MPTKCFCRGIRLSDAVEAEEISHCALHAAAPELLEALSIACHMAKQDLVPSVQRTDDWDKLIAKAKGK
jgi:cytochrome c5